jgi:hypothetical protein
MGDVQSIYEQVMERTRDLNVRSATWHKANNVLNEAQKGQVKKSCCEME